MARLARHGGERRLPRQSAALPPPTHWCCRASCSFSSCFSDSRRSTCISRFITSHCRSESLPCNAVMV